MAGDLQGMAASPRLDWSVFRAGEHLAVVPQTPLLIRLRQMTSDAFFAQEALKPLKSFMDINFVLGPTAILAALYLPSVSGILVVVGLLALTLSALYWFASHWLCATWLRRRGFRRQGTVSAPDVEGARALAAGERRA